MKIAVAGAAGRMGRKLLAAVQDHPHAELVGALCRGDSEALGEDAGRLIGRDALGVMITDDSEAVIKAADCIIDFTRPETTLTLAALTAQHQTAHVIGTTGLTDQQKQQLNACAEQTAMVHAHNFSVGVNLLLHLVEKTAKTIPEDQFDIEVLEMHHKHKVDAPSGTALSLGEAAARGRGRDLKEVACYAREGITGERPQGEIGFATLRGGDVIGDHTVMFASPFERIELTHKAQDRAVFAEGAVRAALWTQDKAPGHYSMKDVLNLD